MATAFAALADPRRRDILRLLAHGELAAGAIAQHFELTRQAVSHHLQRLKEAGLLEERRAGQSRLYRVRREGLAEVLAFTDQFWDARLEALRRELEP